MFDKYSYLRNKYASSITFKIFKYYKEKMLSLDSLKQGNTYRIFYMEPKSLKLGKLKFWLPPKPKSCTGKFEYEEKFSGIAYIYFTPFDLVDLKVNSYGNTWFVLRLT